MTQQPTTPKKRKALGQPTPWTDAKLAEMSLINDADIADALKLWESEAPGSLKGLLKAKVEEQK